MILLLPYMYNFILIINPYKLTTDSVLKNILHKACLSILHVREYYILKINHSVPGNHFTLRYILDAQRDGIGTCQRLPVGWGYISGGICDILRC